MKDSVRGLFVGGELGGGHFLFLKPTKNFMNAMEMLFGFPKANVDVLKALFSSLPKDKPRSVSWPQDLGNETFTDLLKKTQHGRSSGYVDPEFKPMAPVYR